MVLDLFHPDQYHTSWLAKKNHYWKAHSLYGLILVFYYFFLFLPSRTNSVHLCSWSMQRKKIHIYGRKRWEFSTYNCYSKMFNIRMIHSTMDEVELDVVIQRVDTIFHWINHCLVDDSGNLDTNYL